VNTKGVEDGIVCEFCGTHCYKGAEHNARVEDNARFHDPQTVQPPPAPTFACQLAMYLTRNGADAPHMQAEINRFLYEGKWQTTQGAK
jgi:hypothetical protein